MYIYYAHLQRHYARLESLVHLPDHLQRIPARLRPAPGVSGSIFSSPFMGDVTCVMM